MSRTIQKGGQTHVHDKREELEERRRCCYNNGEKHVCLHNIMQGGEPKSRSFFCCTHRATCDAAKGGALFSPFPDRRRVESPSRPLVWHQRDGASVVVEEEEEDEDFPAFRQLLEAHRPQQEEERRGTTQQQSCSLRRRSRYTRAMYPRTYVRAGVSVRPAHMCVCPCRPKRPIHVGRPAKSTSSIRTHTCPVDRKRALIALLLQWRRWRKKRRFIPFSSSGSAQRETDGRTEAPATKNPAN